MHHVLALGVEQDVLSQVAEQQNQENLAQALLWIMNRDRSEGLLRKNQGKTRAGGNEPT